MEINPFHNGHKYFLDQVRTSKEDTLICVVSTSFTQRGEISVLNKKVKTQLLLDNGVDIVVELPSIFANQGGLYFAKQSIELLKTFNITHLAFGSESDNLDLLLNIVDKNIGQKDFKNGLYREELLQLNSNDILGISYLKAIKDTNIQPVLIKRIKNNYNDSSITGNIASATSIRNNIKDNSVIQTLPAFSYANILDIDEKLLFNLFKVSLSNCIHQNINIFLSEDMQLLYKFEHILKKYSISSIDELCNYAKDKNNSIHKLHRIILNTILLASVQEYKIEYVRVLGFNKRASYLLKDKEIITSLKHQNGPVANYEKRASQLFSIVTSDSSIHDYNKPIIV